MAYTISDVDAGNAIIATFKTFDEAMAVRTRLENDRPERPLSLSCPYRYLIGQTAS